MGLDFRNMGTIRILNGNGKKSRARDYKFTVVVLPVYEIETDGATSERKAGSRKKALRRGNPTQPSGYQITVSLLPGLITYGRTLGEVKEMAQDAIRVHVEGLRKAGEAIPDEREAQFKNMRVSVFT
jgi:predicted RNase H-like HicB family nuclease